jgi:hypothetical protein
MKLVLDIFCISKRQKLVNCGFSRKEKSFFDVCLHNGEESSYYYNFLKQKRVVSGIKFIAVCNKIKEI